MKKSERILIIITICAVVFFLANWARGPKGTGGSMTPIVREEVLEFPGLPEIDDKYIVAFAEERLDFFPIAGKMNDPFTEYVPHVEQKKNINEKPLRFTGVFYDGDRNYAFINDDLVAEGESINSWTVTKISEEGVWLTKDEKKRFLKLHIKVEQDPGPSEKKEE